VRPPAAWAHEWRQFRLLVRVSYRRLLDAALASRDIDADQFALWGAALLATPMLYAAFIWPSRYPWLRARSLDALHDAVLADRLFFVIWPMLVALLVGVLMWDGLFPDRTDQQVLGVLPVRSRTVAAARITAALTSMAVLLAGISLPATVVYALAGAAHSSVGSVPGIFVGQLLASVSAGLFAFGVLLTARGAIVWLVGAAAAARIAIALQLLAVVAAFEAFMFLPGLLPAILRHLLAPDSPSAVFLPPAWFMGVYARFAGPHAAVLSPLAGTAVVAAAGALAAALAAYVLPARVNARRAIEAREAGHASSPLAAPLVACGALLRRPSARARYVFVILGLLRSRRHLLIVATYLGLGVALAGTRVLSASIRGRALPWDQPVDYLLVVPLVLTFFLVLGVRAAFAVPTDLSANWVFRVVGPRNLLDGRSAVRLAFHALAVLPVSAITLVAATWLWGWQSALAIAGMHAASGLLLCEVALRGHESIPFTKARALSTSSMKVGVAAALGAVYLFAFRFDDLQVWALGSPARSAGYVLVALSAAVLIALLGRRQSRASPATFDAPDDHAVTQLKLSEASL
jgi:hypothetical protein